MTDQKGDCQFDETLYQNAIEAANVGMWDWDFTHHKLIWSKEFKALMGLPPETKADFKLFLSLIHPDDRERILTLFAESMRAKTPHDVVYRITRPDGSLRWIADRGRFLFDEQGTATRIAGVIWDITAKRQAQEGQQRADRHVREILEGIGEAFFHLDPAWRFTYLNSQAIQMAGHSHEENLLGRTFWEIYPQMVGCEIERTFRQVMEARQPAICEAYAPTTQRWYDVRIYPAEKGGITCFHTDITERKLLEQERDQLFAREKAARQEAEAARQQSDELVKQLEEKQAFLQTIMQQAPSGLVIAEALQGKLIGSNEEALKLLGSNELKSEGYPDYVQFGARHADGTSYRAEEYPLTRALLFGEIIKQEDMLYQRKDERQIHLEVNAAPVYGPQGKIVAAITTFHDVSERFELEQKKDEFIRLASHELRTPLTSLKGNLQLTGRRLQRLLRDEQSSLAREGRALFEQLATWNERALRQANVEGRLLNDLLDACNIQTQELRVALEAENLVQIVRGAVDDMQALAPPHSLLFERPEQAEIPVMVDGIRIGQVVAHYIKNALKYASAQQPIIVGIQVEKSEAEVWVKDCGPGLSADAQRYIWERFRQASGFTGYSGSGGSGLGLGLYICQKVVQLHRGRTGVESAPKQGSTFWFTLPLLEKRS